MEFKSAVVLLNGENYGTWRVQAKMCLVKDGLWSIVNGTETAPTDPAALAKFDVRKDRALATLVLAVDPKLLYLIGDPESPIDVWNRLQDVYHKKTWANKLRLRKRLYGMKLQNGGNVQEHLKTMVELFDALAAVGSALQDEDRVICLLASLPTEFDTLVTTLETLDNVPTWEAVTERLLRQEEKKRSSDDVRAYVSQENPFSCHRCGKKGHFRRSCPTLKKIEAEEDVVLNAKAGKYSNVSLKNSFLFDSACTKHMSHDRKLFKSIGKSDQKEVLVGNGKPLEVRGQGEVMLSVDSGNGGARKCRLQNVLYVPKLSHNLLSVAKISHGGKSVNFNANFCSIVQNNKTLAFGRKYGDLYVLAEHRQRKHVGRNLDADAQDSSRSYVRSYTAPRRLILCKDAKYCSHVTCR